MSFINNEKYDLRLVAVHKVFAYFSFLTGLLFFFFLLPMSSSSVLPKCGVCCVPTRDLCTRSGKPY